MRIERTSRIIKITLILLRFPSGCLCPISRRSLALAVMMFAAMASSAADNPTLPPLTTASRSPRLPGKFVWADLLTDDVAAARKFYSRLFGWTFRDIDSYTIAANDDRPLCGIIQRPKPASRPQAKPRWISYISVDSIEGALRVVTKSGGEVLAAAQKIPKRGEQALCADAEGAVFGLVKSSSGDPQDFMADPGDWIWIQLLSRDARRAADFYCAVARYDIVENTHAANNQLSDFVLTSEGFARATVRTIPADKAQVQPKWLPFVRVKDMGDSVALAKQLGGKILLEPKPDFFHGRVAVIADPTGAVIGLLEWSDELMKGAR